MPNLLFMGTSDDKSYLHKLKPHVGTNSCKILLDAKVGTLTELEMAAKRVGVKHVLFTDSSVLHKLAVDNDAKISDYAGSHFRRNDIEFVCLSPLAQTITVPHGDFLLGRYISKFTRPDEWGVDPEFTWEIAREGHTKEILERFADADLIAVDIETFKENLAIRCSGYCGVWLDGDRIRTHTVVVPFTSIEFYSLAKALNELPAAKITQNGLYDHAYFIRYAMPCTNWLWDTAGAMHSWYSELPKDLGFLGSFFRREGRYWKDLAHNTANLEEYYLYNARDCYNTAVVMCRWLVESPAWAKRNYTMKFKMNFPSLLASLRGVKCNLETLEAKRKEKVEVIERKNKELGIMAAAPGINSNSPQQIKALLSVLGCADIAAKSSDEKSLKAAMFRHPLNNRVLQNVIDIRGERKIVSTYLVPEKIYHGRLLYNLIPYGAKTGRNACQESSFWCGFQIQNIPAEDLSVKECIEPDPGFLLAEADRTQAETRGTAHISGDTNLLKTISSGKDFHSLNASSFFGIPYEQIYDDATGKKLDKVLRDLAKRVNHGANYNMGALVLLETMGLENVVRAQKLLKLNKLWSPMRVCQFLLDQFDKTYPKIRGEYQDWIKYQVLTHRILVGPTGWTRYCFGNPSQNKLHLNEYVAHPPQSLNAMELDESVWRVFVDICLHPEHSKHFKFHAQIHDSIFYSYRIGHDYFHDMVRERMEISTDVTDISGVKRTMIIPVEVKAGGKTWATCGE